MTSDSKFRDEGQPRRSAEAFDELVAALRRSRSGDEVVVEAQWFGEIEAINGATAVEVVNGVIQAAEQAGVALPGAAITQALRGFAIRRYGASEVDTGRDAVLLATHLARTSALQRISHAATASLDLRAMLQTVVPVVCETVVGDSCSIFLHDAATNTLVLRATVGLNPDAVDRVTLPLGVGITGTAALRREPVIAADALHHPAYLDDPRVGDRPYASQVSVPLLIRSPERLIGVMNILSRQRREFSPEDVSFLTTAADEISVAIENARLYSETDAQLRTSLSQLATLQQLSRLVASTLELSELLHLIGVHIAEIAGAEAVEIYGYGPEPTGAPNLRLLERHSRANVEPGAELRSRVRELGLETVTTRLPLWSSTDEPPPLRYVHVLPMVTARRPVGVICLFHGSHPSTPEDDERFLVAFADSAAMAIENAELYEEARRGYARASTLLQEMHHRVRNNLQTVASLLSMQARHAGSASWTQPLHEAVSRINSIAAVHDILSVGNLRSTTVDAVARHIVEEASINVVPPGVRVSFIVQPSSVEVSSRQATMLALVINELINNAVVHGFAGRQEGTVVIATTMERGDVVVELRDDGGGLPEGFDLERSQRLGLQIVKRLVESDLRGSFELAARSPTGARALVRFPVAG